MLKKSEIKWYCGLAIKSEKVHAEMPGNPEDWIQPPSGNPYAKFGGEMNPCAEMILDSPKKVDLEALKQIIQTMDIPFGVDVVEVCPGITYDVALGQVTINDEVLNAKALEKLPAGADLLSDDWVYHPVTQEWKKKVAAPLVANSSGSIKDAKSPEAVLASFRLKPKPPTAGGGASEAPQKHPESSSGLISVSSGPGGKGLATNNVWMTVEMPSGKIVECSVDSMLMQLVPDPKIMLMEQFSVMLDRILEEDK